MDQDEEARQVVLEILAASFANGDSESRKIHMDLAAMPLAVADPVGAMTRLATSSMTLLHEIVPFLARAYGKTPVEIVKALRE